MCSYTTVTILHSFSHIAVMKNFHPMGNLAQSMALSGMDRRTARQCGSWCRVEALKTLFTITFMINLYTGQSLVGFGEIRLERLRVGMSELRHNFPQSAVLVRQFGSCCRCFRCCYRSTTRLAGKGLKRPSRDRKCRQAVDG